MNQSWIIFRYIGRHYVTWLLIFLFGLAGIIWLFETAELLRRAASKDTGISIVLLMGLFKLPETIDRALPFVILFAALFTFWRMTRSQELIIVRAAGVSVWQFLMPVLTATILFSVVNVAVINPIGARMVAHYYEMEATYLRHHSTLELTGAGLWLRQFQDGKEYLLHTDKVELDPLRLSPLMAIIYGPDNKYAGRIDARRAVLEEGRWRIHDAWLNEPGKQPKFMPEMQITTDMTYEKIQESMASPRTVSFWELPQFIVALQSVGLPVLRHKLQLHALLAQPWFLCAMAFFAAAFALRLNRQGGILFMVSAGVVVGILAFTLNNVLVALGTTQIIPVLLSAWAAPIMCIILGIAALLYLEDG
ncbi:MAG: LptF/LptG family permease [Alphaproteobacteria bacterium]|nr:LptF/LptG family permease [Alphaproteobacteria bacterium]